MVLLKQHEVLRTKYYSCLLPCMSVGELNMTCKCMQKAGGTGTSNPNLGAYQVIREQVEMFFFWFEQEAYWSH